ncbi:alpha-D-xyloside xylohydrolase [Dysgonomonas sp. PFB1-18]|uniref:glycoside hydrolase family 31 protein n=1 Tax=unclassified Dysgonomonas TaxID=2630389 RepID=UPI002473E238|nr:MULTISPECIES: TIM-barrel domain-containing protein [unclassified Dysgonomonas]MDH6311079.1 alpha-D-xyloside xylohydrolase [Dysgonomonas sp. PF1-14]MDH6340938.1 alpha-D-xyloside xylohydrolase [Dysgonomonas sp. PF1-16]MDH6382615.1 alpha-D-xyloside xylohydrolase [Dysgonomonas sp. PFB1-18]MDH6399944.1 alpha-D-xyloside xylohydrolase [Dysgonomonas sp. PF1-23]
MKKTFIIFLILALSGLLNAQNYQKTSNGVKTQVGTTDIEVQFYSPTIVRVLKYPKGEALKKKSLAVIKEPETTQFNIERFNNVITLASSDVVVTLNLTTGDVAFNGTDTRPFIAERSVSSVFTPKQYKSGKTYEVKQTFLLDKQEAVYGLGQHQQGHMNQRGQEVYLRQSNTEIAIPIIHSVKGYAVYWDNYAPTTYNDSYEGLLFTSSSGKCIDYYFMYGKDMDGTIAQIRDLTGQAPMFPLWTYGFWQSRERYVSQDELIGVVKKYRDLGVPLDGIIQDWQYWSTNNKHWNAIEYGNPEFPNPKKMIDDVHKLNAHIAISVWPSFGPETNIHKELKKKKMLFDFDTYPHNIGVRVYDAFNPEARKIYWDYMNKNQFALGMDSWWLDATEPEDNSGNEELNYSTYLGTYRDVANAYPLVSVGGVYDHQRKVSSDKRVYILTRSAFAGQQRYGANSWSGDIDSRWNVLHDQIAAGLNFSLCGIPYWNTDIGGFWAGRAYPEGIKDKAYHELYVRWLQFGTFTPMMRSHGTNTPREIFQFGEKGNWAYDAQEKYINMRYSLLPYMYSIGYDITQNAGSMMRALSMDFAQDEKVHDIDNQYMFGKSILVIPVTDSMYVDRIDGKVVENFNTIKSQKVYLPKGADWYDFWTGEKGRGGQTLSKSTPIDIIPLYIKAGSILPWGPKVQYAEEKKWDDLDIFVYPGADAEFVLYEDENNNYNYERGAYATIKMKWDDKAHTLTIGASQGEFPGMLKKRNFKITLLGEGKSIRSSLGKPDKLIVYQGQEINVKM